MHLYKIIVKPFLVALLLTATISVSYAQEQLKGTVSFTTSQNIYVRFENAQDIKIGDTLRLQQGPEVVPCLVVISKSSTSCVTKPTGDCRPEKGSAIVAVVQKRKTKIQDRISKEKTTEEDGDKGDAKTKVNSESTENADEESKPDINGRLSMANYTTRDNVGTKNRAMGRLAFNIDDLAPGLSLESYMNFTNLSNTRTESGDFRANQFNIFNLALGYKKDSNYSVYVGRRINNNLASMGAVDGVQAEKEFGNFSVGVVGGFRPGIFNYSVDFNLPQFGGYVAYKQNHKVVQSRTTMGIVEQRNGGATDRRYALVQHSSQIKKLSFFGSAQMDLYEKVNNTAQSDFKVTSLYVSLRYRLNRRLSVMGSFDNRRNLIFYESYASSLNFLTQNNPSRQGMRLRVSYRMGSYLTAGLSYNTRVQSDNANAFTNYNAYLRHSKLPLIGGSIFLSYNNSENTALNYSTASANYRRAFLKGKVALDAYYRMVNYKYKVADFALPSQHYFGGGLNIRMAKKTTLSAMVEHTQRETYSSDRLNLKLIQRF